MRTLITIFRSNTVVKHRFETLHQSEWVSDLKKRKLERDIEWFKTVPNEEDIIVAYRQ